MSLVPGFEYDIFISYASVDDVEPMDDAQKGWVTMFVRYLEAVLAVRLAGKKVAVYFDRRNLAGNHQLQELLDAAKGSALFLAIASPAYAGRSWTRDELATFVKNTTDLRRLFAVEYMPLDDNDTHPQPLDSHKRLRFWERDYTLSNAAMPLRATEEAFRSRIHDLADQIKRQLVSMTAAEMTRPAISQAAGVIADDAAIRANGVIYLAQSTEDLEEERLQVQRYLEQFRYRVLPSTELPGGGEAFRAAITGEIKQADFYVHLLGRRGGRSPVDLPDGYGATQIGVAKSLGKPLLLWHHPDLDVDTVADAKQKALLGDRDVVAVGLQQFKEEIRRRMDALARQGEKAAAGPSLVFINAARNDHEVAKIAQEEFAARNMSVAIPLFEGPSEEVQKDLTENMKDCDVMIFIYGDAPAAWVRGQLRLFSKIRPETPAKMVAIFVGPPGEQHGDLGFAMPGLRRINFSEGWSAEQIREVIKEFAA